MIDSSNTIIGILKLFDIAVYNNNDSSESFIKLEGKDIPVSSVLLFDPNYNIEVLDDYRNANYKLVIISVHDKYVLLLQDHWLNKGGIFWDGSYIMLRFVMEYFIIKNKTNIIEIGAGTSLPSLYISKHTSNKVVSTDINKLLPFINKIRLLNNNSNLITEELNWGDTNKCNFIKENIFNNDNIDLIICSEVIYIKEESNNLINTLTTLSSNNTVIIFTYKVRLIEVVQEFLNKLSSAYHIKDVNKDIIAKYQKNNSINITIACKDSNILNNLVL